MYFISNKLNIHGKLWKDYKGKIIFTLLQPIESFYCLFSQALGEGAENEAQCLSATEEQYKLTELGTDGRN